MKILDAIDNAHDLAVALIVKGIPFAAPLPNAFVAFHSLTESMGATGAFVTAAVVELTGFAVAAIMLRAVNMRAGRFVVSVAGFGLGLYMLTIGLIIWSIPSGEYPEAVKMLPAFSVTGAVLMGVQRLLDSMETAAVDARRLEIDLADYEERLRIERRALSRAAVPPVSQVGQSGGTISTKSAGEVTGQPENGTKRDRVAKYLRDNPGASDREVEAATGVSKSTVNRWRRE